MRFEHKAVPIALAAVLIDTIGFGIVAPVFPALLRSLGETDIEQATRIAGWMLVVYAGAQFFAGPVLGNLSDRFGRRPVLIASMVSFGLDYAVMAVAPSVGWLFAGRAIAGIAGAVYGPAGSVIADVTPPEKRAGAFGLMGVAFSVGFEGRPPCDERADAAQLAADLAIPLVEIECRTADVVESFPHLCRAKDDPIADISGFGYWALMRTAREHDVPVLLLGQGGDELFWGYGWPQEGLRQTLRKQQALARGRFPLHEYVRVEAPPRLSPWGLRTWWQRRFGWADGLAERARDMRSPVEPEPVQHTMAERSSVSAICRAASAMASAPVASAVVR